MTKSYAAIEAVGADVEGVIRFAVEQSENGGGQTDQFEITNHVYRMTGHNLVADKHPAHAAFANSKVIPIRLVSNDIGTNLKARYEAFDPQAGRLLCAGDGSVASRVDLATGVVNEVACVGPEACSYAQSSDARCALKLRLRLQLDFDEQQRKQLNGYTPSPVDIFEFSSSSINTARTLLANLTVLKEVYKKLSAVPLDLCSFEKRTPQSNDESFFVARLKPRHGLTHKEIKDEVEKAADDSENIGIGIGLIDKVAVLGVVNAEHQVLMPSSVARTVNTRERAVSTTTPTITAMLQAARDTSSVLTCPDKDTGITIGGASGEEGHTTPDDTVSIQTADKGMKLVQADATLPENVANFLP
jgi:Recombination directionality factor-like